MRIIAIFNHLEFINIRANDNPCMNQRFNSMNSIQQSLFFAFFDFSIL